MRESRDPQVMDGHTWLLQADYCAEHEWGIDDLHRSFEIEPRDVRKVRGGIEGYRIHTSPVGLYYCEFSQNEAVLGYNPYLGYRMKHTDGPAPDIQEFAAQERERIPYRTTPKRKSGRNTRTSSVNDEIVSGWDSKSLLIRASGEANVEMLRTLKGAFYNEDVAIWVGGVGPFNGGYLVMSIISKLPEEHKQTMLADEQATAKLYNDADATGIYQRFQGLGKLTPGKPLTTRMNYHDRSAGACEVNTAYPVMFFFQPWDRKYIPGWFTVEEMNGALDGTNDFMLAR